MTVEELRLELRSLYLLTRRREDELKELDHENYLVLKGQRDMACAIMGAIVGKNLDLLYVYLKPL